MVRRAPTIIDTDLRDSMFYKENEIAKKYIFA